MTENNIDTHNFKEGFIDGSPIIIGYLPIAMTFGILSKTAGLTMLESILCSGIVFAGASQFIALNLLIIGAGMGEIILTTLLVNFRHFLMSASLARNVTEDMKNWKFLMAFAVTDEVFSIVSFKKGKLSKGYIFAVESCAYFSWTIGTGLGYLVGSILPRTVQLSMEIAIYAMFTALLVPEMKKSKKIILIALLSGIVNTICKIVLSLPQGWSIVISIVLVSIMGIFVVNEKELG